jgi:micrococcal nuclease
MPSKKIQKQIFGLLLILLTLIVGATTQKVPPVAAPAQSAGAALPLPQSWYQVTRVIDGDTIEVSIDGAKEKIRLIGLDTPELVDPRKPVQCFAQEASDYAKKILANQKVRIELDESQGVRDKYGRMLAYIFLADGTLFNKYMIEHGYGHEYTYTHPYHYQSEFNLAEQNAQKEGRGLWAPRVCGV